MINFSHFLSSPCLVQGIWLTLQQLAWFYSHSYSLTHSSLWPGKDQRPCCPHPQIGIPATLLVNHKWPHMGASVGPDCAWRQARHSNGQGTGRTGFRPAFSHLRESWETGSRRGHSMSWGDHTLGPAKVGHSWIQSHQEGEQAWLSSVNTLVGSKSYKPRAMFQGAPEAWWGWGKSGEYCSWERLAPPIRNWFTDQKYSMCG